MERLIVFIIVFAVTQSFILLEEETLIILASIIWLDAAGSLIRELLWTELEDKGNKIKESFAEYLVARKELLEKLIAKHEKRASVSEEIKEIYNTYVHTLVEKSLERYVSDSQIVSKFEVKNDIVVKGMGVINDILLQEVEELLKVVNSPNVGQLDWFSEGSPLLKK